jgi:hypothetical protein
VTEAGKALGAGAPARAPDTRFLRCRIGPPIAPIDSLGTQLEPGGPSHREKGKRKTRAATETETDDFDPELNEEEELRLEEERLLKRNQQSLDETRMGVPGPANFSPAGPSADEDAEPTKRGRQKNLRKLSNKAKARATTKKDNPAVAAADEKNGGFGEIKRAYPNGKA